MQSKKTFLLATLTLLILQVIHAQVTGGQSGNGKFYVKIYGGYGLLTPGSYKPYSSGTGSVSVSGQGLGSGLHYGGGIGYVVNDFLNIGLDADYLDGRKITTTTGSASSPYVTTFTHSVFSIIPNITFKALSEPTYYIYNRLGIIMAVNTKLNQLTTDSTSNGNNLYSLGNDNTKYTVGFSAGVQAAIGVQFEIAKNIKGFGEIVGSYLPVTPSSSYEYSLTKAYSGGGLSGSNITIFNDNYIKSGPTNYSATQSTINGIQANTYSQNLPTSSQYRFDINYIGINIGAVYKF